MRRALCVTLLLLAAGCGVKGVEGHYEGTVSGSIVVIGIPLPVLGNIEFDLVAAGGDLFRATGDLVVRRKSDGVVTYEANLSGDYVAGQLSLTFVATDGKSSGTMKGGWSNQCFHDGTWTISGTATSGSGSWEACR